MRYQDKRTTALPPEKVQDGNRKWWTDHTMSYDWKDPVARERFSPEWFAEIDSRFLHAARLFSDQQNPFQDLLDLSSAAGKRVLEIGCGMGMHTEMLSAAGAQVTSIDLSPTSVAATTKRLSHRNLSADVRQMDAERLEFPSGQFDLVWSWGVIHHSSKTGRIVREIARVLRPGGQARIMVYNLEGAPAYVTLATRYLAGFWRGASLDRLLWQSTDGFSARFYTRDMFRDLLATFFDTVELSVTGQDADVVPLPGPLRGLILPLIPLAKRRALASKRGAYLFAVAEKAADSST